MVGHNTAALVRRATESGEILNLGNSKLGSLSAESWKALGAAIEGNAAIKELLLHSNNLGALKPQGWKWLAQALERSPSVHKVLLMSNNLAKLDSPQAWEMFANALVNNERLDDLYLDDQGDIFHMLTERELTHFRRGRQAVAKRSVDRYVRQAIDCRGLLKKTSAQLGSLHVASGGTDAWHRFSQAIKQNEHITGLLFNSNNLGELELASFKILAELVESSSTLRYLDLGGNHLEALDRADQTDGDEDAEGAGSRGRWAMLTNALHRNRSLRDLSLRGNDLSAISDAGWAALMNFLEHDTSIIDLSLRETGLGKMPLARWEQLACAIRGNSTLLTLQLRGNAVRQQCSLQIKRVLAGSLMGHRTLVHVYGADDLFRVLGPFAHTPSYPWKPAYMSFWEFRASLFYGIFPFSSGALLGRLFWLSLCLVAFLAPRWYSTDWDSLQGSALRASLADLDAAILLSGQSVNGTDAVDDLLVQLLSRGAALEKLSADSLAALASGITKNASIAAVFNDAELAASVSSNATELITVGALGKLCTHVPDALNHAYVNAVSGYSILLASYLAMMVYMRMGRAADKQRKGTWRGCGVGSAAAACAGGRTLEEWAQTPPFVCCRRHLASGARCISQATQRVLLAVMPSSSSSSSSPGQNGDDDETETAGGGDKKSAESARNVRDSDSHQKAFFMLVQVLCAFNALGTYFNPHAEFVPTGSGLCKPAFVGLSVFFKPLALPVTYCILVASDTSGRMLLHTPMTETLAFAVQMLALSWLVVIGVLSLPLLCVAFPFFGLVFSALYFYYVRVFLPRYWSDASGMDTYKKGDSGKWKKVDLTQWDVLKRFKTGSEGGRRDWYRLDNDLQDQLLAAEQLGTVLLLRTAPFALCFGISLWGVYLTRDYTAELAKMYSLVLGVIPLVDFSKFLSMLRWPSELALPEQIPLAVSVGALVAEHLPILWRRFGPGIAGTTTSAQAAFNTTRRSKDRHLPLVQPPQPGPATAKELLQRKTTKGGTKGARIVV